MEDEVYTLGAWKVKPGREVEFIAAWKALGQIFYKLPNPPGTGRLIQSVSDPEIFYSFGPWKRLEDIEAMRSDPKAQEGIQRLVSLCTEAAPGAFRVVAQATSSFIYVTPLANIYEIAPPVKGVRRKLRLSSPREGFSHQSRSAPRS